MNDKKKCLLIGTVVVMLVFVSFTGCVKIEKNFVEMRDGVKLATDVYRPRNQQSPHGSILIRTPYNKNPLSVIGIAWANNGWPTVIQDMRGRDASEGNDTVFRNAHTDGPDTAKWIGQQTWSNGKIATFGGSALGICQYFMAGAAPPELACQFIQVATPDLYHHAMYQGGEFREKLVVDWLAGQGSTYILEELWEQENYTVDYWTNVSLLDNWGSINVPAIHIGGWYDIFSQGTIDGFYGYQYFGDTGALGNSKLIMGPWTHGGAKRTQQGALTYPENCIDTFSDELFWEMVNEYTMENPGSYSDWPAVYYYTMGDVTDDTAPGNIWNEADEWPVTYTEQQWYFHEDGSMTTTPPDSTGSSSYVYAPQDPVPTEGGGNLNMKAGPFDQTLVENRSDVLVFTSDVLTEPYEATGPIQVHLAVSSNCSDTDFTAKLTDVYPDGRSMLITDGILRMRNRNGSDHWEFMTPGEIYEIDVDLWSTSYIWNTGHQIRVAISSSNYPRFLNNPNTRDGIHANNTYQKAHNTVYVDSTYPSYIVLPKVSQPVKTQPPIMPLVHLDLKTKAQKATEMTCQITDPEDNQVYILFDWGDGSTSGWLGPYDSDEVFTVSHQWNHPGSYQVRYIAKDTTNAMTPWSTPQSVYISNQGFRLGRIKSFIMQHQERFPRLTELMVFIENKKCYIDKSILFEY